MGVRATATHAFGGNAHRPCAQQPGWVYEACKRSRSSSTR